MASRRARLKAVANLPVRRKPSSQDCVESAELEKTEDNPVLSQDEVKVNVNENEGKCKKKEPSETESKSSNVAETLQPAVTESETGSQAKKLNKEQSTDNNSDKNAEEKKEEKKSNTSAGPARFGRRIKPIVCLPIRKERVQTEKDPDKSTINKVEPAVEEIEKSELTQASDKSDVNNKKDSSNLLKTSKVPASVTQSTANQQIVSTVNQEPNNDKTSSSSIVNVNKEIKSPQKSDKILTNVTQSPSKIQRPVFLRPNIDLSFRRGDDHKNVALSPRIRNISESSNSGSVIMQNIASQTDSSAVDGGRSLASILKRKRAKSNDLTRKMADARRDFHRRYEKIKPDRSSLRMIDLIFYNPATNPMMSKSKMEKKESASDDDELLTEAKVDEPDPMDISEKDDYDDEDLGKMPVPQVKIGLNGEIILDEKSLVIETTDAKKGREDLQNSVPVFEDRSSKMSYYCRKSKKSKDWSDSETKRFYKALNTLGTDFLLMKEIFPNRSRLELKNKFKREEKLNRNLIDKALSNPSEFDMTELQKDLADEQRIEEEENEVKLQKKLKPRPIEHRARTKTSFLAREMVESDSEMSNGVISDDLSTPPRPVVNLEKQKAKKMKDANMLYEKLIMKEDLKGIEVKTSTSVNISDPNENISKCNNLNISETTRNYKSHRRKSKNVEVDDSAINKPVESTNLNNDVAGNDDHDKSEMALDLSKPKEIPEIKKPVRNSRTGKRKVEPIVGKTRNKKRKQEHAVYPPGVNEEPEPSNEGNKADLIVTKTITDDDFLQLLAANVKCMKESKIKVQVSNNPEKKIEVIFDDVTPITAKEIEDQNITVLADCNSTICEDESPASPDECEKIEIHNAKETSVIVENPNAFKKDTVYEPQKLEEPCKEDNSDVVNNENVMVVINENDQGLTTEYQYMLVEEQEVETLTIDNVAQNVEIEDEVNVEVEEKNEKPVNLQLTAPVKPPSIVVCKQPQSESDKMFLAGLSAGSFVLMASDSPNEQKEKKFSMFMISEKSQSDGSSVLSSIPVILPPELVNSLTQEMGCS